MGVRRHCSEWGSFQSTIGGGMPLAFESIRHGTVAFGFFNIESDMLLLEHYFFFADDFCKRVGEMAQWEGPGRFEREWEVYHIATQSRVGDLMGAIHGVSFTGFIGELYRKFPFPSQPEDFRQKAEGWKTQGVVEEIIGRYGQRLRIPLAWDGENRVFTLSEFRFSKRTFQEFIQYVWVGGYPRWKHGVRPEYVEAMGVRISESRNPLFQGLVLEP
jgi:hypothetical protein